MREKLSVRSQANVSPLGTSDFFPTLVIWFSCGAASAVAAKICLAKYADTHEVVVVRIVVSNEHVDNDRFASDCEKWLGVPIITLTSDEYADCWEVWEKEKFLVSPYGSPCTGAMKKRVRFKFEQKYSPDIQAYGYTAEEQNRAERFRQQNSEIELLAPLIDEGISKSDCLSLIERAGIELPAMYKLGFNNNNCIGCPKGGMGYWNRIRIHFPDVFERVARLERKLNHAICKQRGHPVFLDELSPTAGRHIEPEIECSLFCFAWSQNL